MYNQNRGKIQHNEENGMPRLRYTPPAHTLYCFSWGSVWVDEAHEARTGKALWRAISAILELALVKVLMTATPLLEQPEVSAFASVCRICVKHKFAGFGQFGHLGTPTVDELGGAVQSFAHDS